MNSLRRDKEVAGSKATNAWADGACPGERGRLGRGAPWWVSLVALLLLVAGCSSEGGVVGSGISSVQGNVIEVQLEEELQDGGSASAGAGAVEGDLETVLVSIDDTDLETLTDDDGFFSLDGGFSGPVTVRFRNPDDDEVLGTFLLDMAPGATVFLRDVAIRLDLDLDDSVIVNDPLQLNLAGRVYETDCANEFIVVEGDPPANSLFTIRVTSDTELVDANDDPLACSDLSAGEQVVLEEGLVDLEDRSIVAVRLVADPKHRPARPTEIRARRRGVVLKVECDRGEVFHLVDSRHGDLVRVEMTPATKLLCQDGRSCRCEEIGLGDIADVRGVRHLLRPDSVVAQEIRLDSNPDQFLRRAVTGDIRDIDCGNGLAAIVDMRLADSLLGERILDLPPVDVRLSPETKYFCGLRVSQACRCEDMGKGFRVVIDALIPVAGGPIQALSIGVLALPRISVRGDVVTIECAAGRMVITGGPTERFDVEISPATRIGRGNNGDLACSAIEPGETVRVQGLLLESPGLPRRLILAEEIQLQGR